MRLKIGFLLFYIFSSITGFSQNTEGNKLLDSVLRKKITISKFILCETTLSYLQKLDSNLKVIEVEEMDLGKKCIAEDGRFENGKGYYSDSFPGLVFQKDQTSEQISKIRLTKYFNGNLPNGVPIDMKTFLLKDLFIMYPILKDAWGSRGCSEYYSFPIDNLVFYVKVDYSKKPQFPIDEAYYYDKPIEGIDLLISCYRIFENKN